MKKYNESQLLEERGLRENFTGRTEVLDKVGDLLLLPDTEYATTEQVAIYYGVAKETLNSLVNENKSELESDGFNLFKKNNVIELLNVDFQHLESVVGKSIITLENKEKIEVPNRGLRLFPKRAILRVGMLLRDSEIAKEVRTRLLDIVHDTQEQEPEIVQGVVNEITEEKQLMLDRVEAEMNGDYDTVSIVNAKLFCNFIHYTLALS